MAHDKAPDDLLGVDEELSLYDLTDLFHGFYKYHNEDCLIEYTDVSVGEGANIKENAMTLSRFGGLRRIHAAYLGSKPFFGSQGISVHRPNKSLGYMNLFLTYLSLPYKAVLANPDYSKVKIDKKLHDLEKLSDKELEELRLQSANNPIFSSNAEASDDISDAFNSVLRISKEVQKVHESLVFDLPTYAFSAALHSDIDFRPEPINPLDLVTEPQADWDAKNWNTFFIIRKISASEIIRHINDDTPYWDAEALRWALENSVEERGILNHSHYSGPDQDGIPCGENFSVKSFYAEKSVRHSNIGGYYGNMLVVEGYYKNTKGKINKVIFFPSQQFSRVPREDRDLRKSMSPEERKEIGIDGANVLFFRKTQAKSMQDLITIIPFQRHEKSLERQKAFGHELFSPLEQVMRIDSALMNAGIWMSTPMFADANQGQDAADIQDLELNVGGDAIDLGTRRIVENPFRLDLNGLVSLRGLLLQHAVGKAFLGGLDGTETSGNGRGAELASLRLVRDARVHKHDVEDLAKGLKAFYSKLLFKILDSVEDRDLIKDKLLETKFYKQITKVHGHPEELLEFDKSDILEDTGLPYWMELEAIRNGASHFGAAETIIFREIMQTFGAGLDQQQVQAINRMGIKSLIGSEDAIDILGDPKEQANTNADQVYQATLESSSVSGSVDGSAMNFKPVLIRPQKDDHITHLTQVHLPDAEGIIERLQQADGQSQSLDDLTERQLDTKNNMILTLAAHANHIALHQQQLARFGKQRDDVNQLRERANSVIQASEGLSNSLEANLRALEQKRAEKERRLANISPENEAEKAKIELEREKIAVQRENGQRQLMLANSLAKQRQAQHIDKQISKARDRGQRERESMRKADVDIQKTVINSQTTLAAAERNTGGGTNTDQ